MKIIILYGHDEAAQEAHAQISTLLRERRVANVALILTVNMEQALARALRDGGGELWYCGPNLTPPGGGWSPVTADRYLVGQTLQARTGQVIAAVTEFLCAARRVSA